MSDPIQLILLLVSCLLVATGLMLASRPIGRVLILLALVSAAISVVGLAWDGPLASGEKPQLIAVSVCLALALVAGLAVLFYRRPSAIAFFAVAALPFRLPIELASETFNLLVPLYLVIGGAVISRVIAGVHQRTRSAAAIGERRLDLVLAVLVFAYALQAIYADDVTAAARSAAFFLVPFAALYSVMVSVEWDRRALLGCLGIISVEALVFSSVGVFQEATGEIFWNPALSASNDFHLYFRTNSLFWDPNIYGRYLALALTLLVGYLVWVRDRRQMTKPVLAIALIWVGLLFAWSLSSFIALIAGLLVVVGLRYGAKWALVATPLIVGLLVVFTFVNADGQDPRGEAAAATSGRTSLVSGGLGLARDRPVLGWGSGSFPDAFAAREGLARGQTSVSHNEAITVAAEQGVLGLSIFLAVCVVSLWTLSGGLRVRAPGLGGEPPDESSDILVLGSRIALVAGFVLLLVHAAGYAGLFTDPLTWAVLACGAALADKGRARSAR